MGTKTPSLLFVVFPSTPNNYKASMALPRLPGYNVLHRVGAGKFASVYHAVHKQTKEHVAIKALQRQDIDGLLASEARILLQLHHAHVIRLFQIVETLDHIYLVTEYAPNGDLASDLLRRGRYSETRAAMLMAQIASALAHMHKAGIVHRDIKAENILLVRPDLAKIADFGFSALIGADNELCGSPPYAAPELLAGHSSGPPADIWATGVLLFYMLAGQLPFQAVSLAELSKLIQGGQYSIPLHVTEAPRDLINSLLCQDPSKRPTAEHLSTSAWLAGSRTGAVYCSPSLLLGPASPADGPRPQVVACLANLGIRQSQVTLTNVGNAYGEVSASFRIALHRIQEAQDELSTEDHEEESVAPNPAPTLTPAPPHPLVKSATPQSKLCTIL
eukprot:m.228943 g.228943  ORF g.228943 m.228943 type:complete len:389 (+) comp17629_c0_seq1:227-1393(+)